jgi:hypothetical protein
MGFRVVDSMEEELEEFPSYDAKKVIPREDFLASDFAALTFALVDEICLKDSAIWNHHEQTRHRLHSEDLGIMYVTDALQIAPRLQEDQIFCEFFIECDDELIPVTWEKLQDVEPRNIALIRIPRQQAELALWHHAKLFPKGTLFYREGDTQDGGGDDWLDNTTRDEALLLEKKSEAKHEWAELHRQKSAIEEEIAAVEIEMYDEGNRWRMPAMQSAQRKNRERQSQIDAAIRALSEQIGEE